MADKLVQAEMERVGYYREGTKEELRTQWMDEQTITLAGKEYTLSKISFLDSKIFTMELDTILVQQNPLIHQLFAKNAQSLFDLVRMVNINTKQGFKGALASGNELDFTLFMARQFQDPDAAIGTRRTTWERTITAAMSPPPVANGVQSFFEDITAGAAHGDELPMGEEEGMIWLAFYNPAQVPCIDAFQIQMNTEPFNIQSLDFEQVGEHEGDVIIELKEPWTLPPEQSGRIQAYYFQDGTDETRPLGIWVKMAKNLRALTTP